MKTIVLLTNGYPYMLSVESNFIGPEIPYLFKNFEKIEVYPSKRSILKNEIHKDLFYSDEVVDLLNFDNRLRFGYMLAQGVFGDLFSNIEKYKSGKGLISGIVDRCNKVLAERIFHWLCIAIEEGRWCLDKTVFYSYWCKYTALALSMMKQVFPQAKCLTRAHRGDLYIEESPFRTVTGQGLIMKNMDAIVCISRDGVKYLGRLYPEQYSKIKFFPLGTIDWGVERILSDNDSISIVSCSRVTKVKRVDKILLAIVKLAENFNGLVVWRHFGDGDCLPRLRERLKGSSFRNLRIDLVGMVSLEEIIEYYRSKPVDVFVNSSSSEGLPVSFMEALSCGIPCVGPDVGGNKEVLCEASGGFLMSENPDPEEICSVIQLVTKDRAQLRKRSISARNYWESEFSTENFSKFSDFVSRL